MECPVPEATKEAAPWVADFEARLASQERLVRRARWWRLVGVGVGNLLLMDAIVSLLLLPLFIADPVAWIFISVPDGLANLPLPLILSFGTLRVLIFMLPYTLPPWLLALGLSALRARRGS